MLASRQCLVMLCFTLAMYCGAAAHAAEWGHLTGTFIFDGPAPMAAPVSVTKDPAVCGKHKLVDESLLVNPRNQGVANIVVYLYLRRGAPKPAVHESYAKAATSEVRLDNDKCRFQPHVALLRTTQTLVLGNQDAVGHNTKIDMFTNAGMNPIIPAGSDLKHQFAIPERLPCRVSCSIHPWMNAWLVVKDNPYMAVTDEYGKFEMKNLPVGEWTFQFWHEKSGYVQEVKQAGKSAQWKRGRLDYTIKPGANELGTIHVSPANFEK